MTFARVPAAVLTKVEQRTIKLHQLGLYAVLAQHADNTTGKCWPSRKTLAKECGYRNADDVDKHLRALEAAGVVQMQKRWCSADDPSDRSPEKSERHSVPTSTLYTLPDLTATPTPETPATRTPETAATVTGKHPPKLDPPEPDPEEPTSRGATEPDGFAEFWDNYPKKVGKGQARRAYQAALKRADPSQLATGAQQYRDDPRRRADFTKNPSTWLNGECWADESERPAPRQRYQHD